jgi:hypothetical protein
MEFVHEIFPVLCGIALGILIGVIRPQWRLWVGAPLAVGLGVLATVISGEFRIGWEFLLIDIPLVALAATATLVFTRRTVLRRLSRRPSS